MRKSRLLTLSILNLIGFLGTIVVNGLANALPLNNQPIYDEDGQQDVDYTPDRKGQPNWHK